MNGKSSETRAILKPLPRYSYRLFFDSPIYIDHTYIRTYRLSFNSVSIRTSFLSSHENCHITLRPTITTNPVFPTRNPNNKSGGRWKKKKTGSSKTAPFHSIIPPHPLSITWDRPLIPSPPPSPPTNPKKASRHQAWKNKTAPNEKKKKKEKKEKKEKGKKNNRKDRKAVRKIDRTVKSRSGKERGENRGGRVASDVEHFFPGILLLAGSSNRPSTSARNDEGRGREPRLSRYGTRFSGDPGKTII